MGTLHADNHGSCKHVKAQSHYDAGGAPVRDPGSTVMDRGSTGMNRGSTGDDRNEPVKMFNTSGMNRE
ncbi:hypothetical protein DPMN_088064 [Dreissena polymorpha]|uniref:Uncharacterized protein n=1 Tax=Dreissena polymorpha TaxID=45954 RepID=A0A9D4QXI8_DREPO|nr:hypothetical protein DPMN_088048 [Dreissena polymorpha]KAH3845776.1 hypothetical protein DPMN_088064 [Dreissena polymorpha]